MKTFLNGHEDWKQEVNTFFNGHGNWKQEIEVEDLQSVINISTHFFKKQRPLIRLQDAFEHTFIVVLRDI